MQDSQGVFIVLEGSDGSGKTTQFRLLAERLKAVGYDVELFDFPRYSEPSSYFIKQYLSGRYGPAADISPYVASLFYALDRHEAAPAIKAAIKNGKIVLSNRYVGSNMAHQGSKFPSQMEQRGFFIWEDGLEYNLLGIPRPTLNIFLKVPAYISQELITKRAASSGTVVDEHEKDSQHLSQTLDTYDILCRLFPKDFTPIDCTDGEKLLSIAEINDKIWQVVRPLLPATPHHPPKDIVFSLSQPADSAIKAKGQKPSRARRQNEKSLSLGQISRLAESILHQFPSVTVIKTGKGITAQKYGPARYYQTSDMPQESLENYKKTMKRLAELRSQTSGELKKYLTSGKKLTAKAADEQLYLVMDLLTPLAFCSEIKVKASNHELKSAAAELEKLPFEETKRLAKRLSDSAGPASKRTGRNAGADVMKQSSPVKIPGGDSILLLSASPRNELDVLDLGQDSPVSPKTNVDRKLSRGKSRLTYDQKAALLAKLLHEDTKKTLNMYKYQFEARLDLLEAEDWASKTKTISFTAFDPPLPGDHWIPPIVIEAGLEKTYTQCFRLSRELYEQLAGSNLAELAPYALLGGHKLKRLLECSALDLIDGQNQVPGLGSNGYNRLVKAFLGKIETVHPLLADFLNSYNRNKRPKETKPELSKKK